MSTDWDERLAAAYAEGEIAPEPEPEPEHLPPPERPRHIVAVGSAQWNQPLIVQAVLLGWAHEHGNPPVILTVGMGVTGAEEEARRFGSANGWNVISQTDAGLLNDVDRADVVFAFIRDMSEVSSLVSAMAARRAVRVFRDDVEQPNGSWTRR